MNSSGRRHNTLSKGYFYKAVALLQLLIMLLLAAPACCFESADNHEKSGIGLTAQAADADHDQCPCCPGENDSDSEEDSCSTCSKCSCYAPLIPAIATSYHPVILTLKVPEKYAMLQEVLIPIFVPPQNIS